MSEVETLPAFLKRTAEAAPGPLLVNLREKATALGLKEFDPSAELARMKSYIATYYGGVKPVSSFVDGENHVVDCVPFEQQPAARLAHAAGHQLLAAAPPPASVPGADSSASTAPGPAPATNPCPPGTVAIPRITLDHLVSFGTLENYFRKTRG